MNQQKDLAKIINEARVIQGFSILELSERTGISPSHISRIETNKRNPSVKMLQKLAVELDLDLKEMLALAGLSDKGQNAYFDLDEILDSQFVYANNNILSTKQKNQILAILK